ncbi:hypothetical protein BDBG_05750 [Blastomyces gilchristii SLH14081]|uniref:Uncharacterized protein n=1 Tax=Blastomyces gilchristii (strain SLH14081) TaxID=559298 RepID=A0A179USM1_BLAGS|nr:uncharacterized protein BDBG_05750 [Blastomyces gilchristii SLH14081]OAT10067.1 hypothetical protein BDBG_05750 [Blastomyces gilchristii SLH14081]
MDPGQLHPPYPPPPYTSRPTTPGLEVDDFHDNTPGPSSSAAPNNTRSGAAFHPQRQYIPLQNLPSHSHNAPNNIAENEDSIPAHILAESRELAELHRMALDLTIGNGGADNGYGSPYPDFEDPDGQATHGDASSGYEDFVEPDGQPLPSAQTSIHGGGNTQDNVSVVSVGASHGPAAGVVNASAAAQATQPVIQPQPFVHSFIPSAIRPAPVQNPNYVPPYGPYPFPTVHQIYVGSPAPVLPNAGGGGANQDASSAPNAPNLADNASASTGNPHTGEEYEDWADPAGPPPSTNNNNTVNAGTTAPRVLQTYACAIKLKHIIWILVGLTMFVMVVVIIVLISRRTPAEKLANGSGTANRPDQPVLPYVSSPTGSGVSLISP